MDDKTAKKGEELEKRLTKDDDEFFDREKKDNAPTERRRKSLGFQQAVDITMMVNSWRSVSNARRKIPRRRLEMRHQNTKGDSEHCCSVLTESDLPAGAKRPRLFGKDITDLSQTDDLNRCLLRYFVKVSDCHSDMHTDSLDVEFIVDLLSRGADLNSRDRYQQTVLHEVARNWGPGIMELMVQSGGDVNAVDYRGWTPLHVAAACDYPEMCRCLVRLGADKDAKASNQQTPLFFAAKTDSTKSLRALIRLGCDFNGRDFRGRTPLFAACELDRSATAAVLLQHNADAFVQDNTGQIAFVPLIEKMPPLAAVALGPLHKTYRIERKQWLHLFKLDPTPVTTDPKSKKEVVKRVPYHSAMGAIIKTNNYQVISLPIIRALIAVQWEAFGRFRAIGQIILQLINIILWTAFAVDKEWTQRYMYDFPADGYRIAILAGACLITAYLIIDEIMEYTRARKRHAAWKAWKLEMINGDLSHVHRSHSDEAEYLTKEAEIVDKTPLEYLDDWWNYLDWVCYIILLASVTSHFVDVGWPGGDGNLVVARWHVRIMALNIFVLWIRLLKYVKPFEFFGPFIVMLGMILGDLFKFLLLYLEFFIPFACIFWTILGGTSNLKESDVVNSGTLKNYTNYNFTRVTVDNLDTVSNTLMMLFRLTLVDAYDYKNMVAIDTITAQVLLGAWFAISAILFLNLFIAQLSETFKSVFDNAKAAATMQKAITLQSCYDTMLMSAKVKYHKQLMQKCNPQEIPYDDDVTQNNPAEEQQKATIEIRAMVDNLQRKLSRLYSREVVHSDSDEDDMATDETGGNKSRRMTKSRHLAEKAAVSVRSRLERLESDTRTELLSIKLMLRDIAIVVAGLTRAGSPVSDGGDNPDSDGSSDFAYGGAAAGVRRVTVASASIGSSSARHRGGVGITEVEPVAPLFQRNNVNV